MSEQHARALLKLRTEFGAAIEAATAAREGRCKGSLTHTSAEFGRVVDNAEKTYYVRLCAEIEGMIYVHLGDHYRFDGLPTDPDERSLVPADRLLRAVRYRVNPNTNREIPALTFAAARAAYAYRNRLAHGDRSRQSPVTLEKAFDDLEALILYLPDVA